MPDKRSLSPSRLYFCPRCRRPFARIETCPACHVLANAEAATYVERLLETVLSAEHYRAEMAVDVLTRWLPFALWINFGKPNRRCPYDVSQHPIR